MPPPPTQLRLSGLYINVEAQGEDIQKIVQTFHGHNLNSLADTLENRHTDKATFLPYEITAKSIQKKLPVTSLTSIRSL